MSAAGEDCARGVRVVAVQTGDARVAHAAELDRGPVESLVALLPIGIKGAGVHGQREAEMIGVAFAGGEVFCERLPERLGAGDEPRRVGDGRFAGAKLG